MFTKVIVYFQGILNAQSTIVILLLISATCCFFLWPRKYSLIYFSFLLICILIS